MKKTLVVVLMCGALLLLAVTSLFAQWQPDQWLANGPNVSGCNAWWIGSVNNYVHAVYTLIGPTSNSVAYRRSTNGGVNWLSEVTLWPSENALPPFPSVVPDFQRVHVVAYYITVTNPDNSNFYYRRSPDQGASWENAQIVIPGPYANPPPCAAESNGKVHAVGCVGQSTTYIYYNRSIDSGTTWGTAISLNAGSGPTIAAQDPRVHLAYLGADGLYYRRSLDNGVTWQPPVKLFSYPWPCDYPSIRARNLNVYIACSRYESTSGHDQIFVLQSNNGGASWGSPVQVTNNPYDSRYPNLAVSGNFLHMTWCLDNANGHNLYYSRRALAPGSPWVPFTQLTSDNGAYYPSTSVGGGRVDVDWNDWGSQLLYKRNPTGDQSGGGITDGGSRWPADSTSATSAVEESPPIKVQGLPDTYEISPNPFVYSASIPGHEAERFVLYDVSGRQVGNYQGNRIGSDVRPGVYFLKVEAKNSTLLRIVKLR